MAFRRFAVVATAFGVRRDFDRAIAGVESGRALVGKREAVLDRLQLFVLPSIDVKRTIAAPRDLIVILATLDEVQQLAQSALGLKRHRR